MESTAHPRVVAIENRAYTARIPVKDLLAKAEVSRATWWRLSKGRPALIGTIDRLEGALDELLDKEPA